MGALLLLALPCCSKHFLDEKSQDEVRPSTVTDLQELLMGEVYPAGSTETSFMGYIDMMTDDMTSNFNPDKAALNLYKDYTGPFTWQPDMFESMLAAGTPNDIDTYAHYYRRIMGCNVVLDNIDKMRGETADKENVRGQALAMRGYFYFMLVNLFGQPYNAKGVDIDNSPGVELILSSIVTDAYPARVSVAKIYQQVEQDLLKAMPLMEQYGQNNTKFKASALFVYTLLSRMYLYQEKWTDAQKYATLALQINPKLLNLATIAYPGAFASPATGVYSINSPEAIWLGYADQYEYFYLNQLRPYGPIPFCVSPDLVSKYDFTRTNTSNRGDLRMRHFFMWDYEDYDWTIYKPIVGQKVSADVISNRGPIKGMRVAELYLNRAEGNIRQYLKDGDETKRTAALNDLNFLRSNRYDTRNIPYVNVDYTGQALLDFCKDERRRELCFEDHRWFDLRRYGMPEIKHTFQSADGQTAVEYVLHQADKRYVLPIPLSALTKNPSLQPNP